MTGVGIRAIRVKPLRLGVLAVQISFILPQAANPCQLLPTSLLVLFQGHILGHILSVSVLYKIETARIKVVTIPKFLFIKHNHSIRNLIA